jgi:peptidoglycan/xylan/chitin deacetylase (PgdA/CDA1 family)
MNSMDRPGTTFILSLDCEGLWGMADHISPHLRRAINKESLQHVYGWLLDELDRLQLPATFAFVSTFTMEPDAIVEALSDTDWSPALTEWCRVPLHDLRNGSASGWSLPGIVKRVRSSGLHDVGSHGFTHLPWVGSSLTQNDLTFELEGIGRWTAEHGLDEISFVYPRNLVSHVERLPEGGIRCYRQAPGQAATGPLGRARNLLNEFRRFTPESESQRGIPTSLPGGLMLHWKKGVRRVVPTTFSVRRVASSLAQENSAVKENVLHLWLHPHNLITGKHQTALLTRVLTEVARARDAGFVVVDTMSSYCQRTS